MTSNKSLLFIAFFHLLLMSGCENNKPQYSRGAINGCVETYDDKPYGFEITLEDINDHSIQYQTITNAGGDFYFEDIEAGKYTINATKAGYKWVWMNDDGRQNSYNRTIELEGGHVKNIKILMKTSTSYSSDFDLELTDAYGNSINGSISVPKYSTTVSFRLYNGTGTKKGWSVMNTDKCIVSDDMGVYYEYIFNSFSPTSGTLAPSQSVLLIGNINSGIFNIYTNHPSIVISTLSVYSGYAHKDITLDINF